jgi:hypothetical protein
MPLRLNFGGALPNRHAAILQKVEGVAIASGATSGHRDGRPRTSPKPSTWGKMKPHPVGPFASFGKFICDLVVDVRLSVYKME